MGHEVVQKLIFILAVTILPMFLTVCSAPAETDARTRQIRFGDLQLTTVEGPGNGDYSLKFTKNEVLIFKGECAFKVHKPRIVPDLPRKDCRSLLAYCFSGGAHCCMTLLIATECGTTTSLALVDLAHSAGEVKLADTGQPSKQIKVVDWQFAYYTPEGSDVQLSFADSPSMTRVLVFENGRWRIDRLGEFNHYYAGLLRQSLRSFKTAMKRPDPEAVAGNAIKTTYYGIMSGQSPEEASAVLHRLLPDAWKPQTNKIFQDILAAIAAFDPVEVIR